MRVPTSLTPLYLAAHSTLQPRTEPDTPAHICIRIHAHTVSDTPPAARRRCLRQRTTNKCKENQGTHLTLPGAVVEEAFVENGEHCVENGRVGLEDFVKESDRGCRQEPRRAASVLVLLRETHPLQKRDTSVTQAIEAVGKNPVARMHDLPQCPQREWPKDFLRSREACEQTLEKGPAAQMRQALPQS